MFELTMFIKEGGEVELIDGDKCYSYFGLTEDLYHQVNKLCRQGKKGKVYKILKGFSCIKKHEINKECRS